jgi:hypothetical protein
MLKHQPAILDVDAFPREMKTIGSMCTDRSAAYCMTFDGWKLPELLIFEVLYRNLKGIPHQAPTELQNLLAPWKLQLTDVS